MSFCKLVDTNDVDLSYLVLASNVRHAAGMEPAAPLPTTLRLRAVKRLLALRNDKGLTQAELARRLSVHRALVNKVELGKTNITLDTYERFNFAIQGLSNPTRQPLRELVGEKLRAARVEAGLSQEHLSQVAGFSVLFVGRVERGDVTTSLDRIERLAKVLGIDGASLLYGIDQGDAS